MVLPDINLNGTDRDELQRLNHNACHHLRGAISALNDAAPHGRDYQTQGDPRAIFRALEEHADRVRALHRVLADLEVIAVHIA